MKTKKKALEHHTCWDKTETSWGNNQSRKQITTIVDADDKNCLVQLTVVLEFNQGVRQWLYIIAGVLFFGSFFCTSKRKNINRSAYWFSVLFALMQKEPKKIKPGPKLRRPGRPTHMNTQINCNYTPDWTDSLNQPTSCYSKHRKALSFSFAFF